MKSFIRKWLLIFLIGNTSALSTGLDDHAKVILSDWEVAISRVTVQYDSENLAMLGEALRKLSRKKNTYPEWRWKLYLAAREKTTAIPGHAEFYAKPIWESYAAYRNPDHLKHEGSLTWFSWETQIGMETLKHLPSPETVKVLGEMLREEWEREPNPNSGVDPSQSLAKFSVTSMTLLNIRDAPSTAIEQYSAPEVLADWQAWYEKVKSGEIPFSFKGQAVEYRFNPDGTWETIPIANPPDDAVLMPSAEYEERAKKSPPSAAKPDETEQSGRSFSWWWLMFTAVIAGGVCMLILFRRKAYNENGSSL